MVESISKTPVDPETAAAIVSDAFGPEVTLARFTECTEGWFNAVHRLDLSDGRSVILKVAPPPHVRVLTYEHDLITTEVAMLGLVRVRTTVPVPAVLWWDDSARHLPSPLFLMEACPGRLLSELRSGSGRGRPGPRRRSARRLPRAAARRHRTPLRPARPLPRRTRTSGPWRSARHRRPAGRRRRGRRRAAAYLRRASCGRRRPLRDARRGHDSPPRALGPLGSQRVRRSRLTRRGRRHRPRAGAVGRSADGGAVLLRPRRRHAERRVRITTVRRRPARSSAGSCTTSTSRSS